MKKNTFFLSIILSIIVVSIGYSQKVVVIGSNHNSSAPNTDGLSFVATETINIGENIYFTDSEYNNATNIFNTGEAILLFNVTSTMSAGDVVSLDETGTGTNLFNITCSGGCGTAVMQGASSFSLRTDGEALYAYGDTDAIPSNGITEIYSVLYTGEVGFPIGGNIPAALNPIPDFPNAIVIDGFPATSPGRTEYKFSPATERDGVSKANFENNSNYLHAQSNQVLSIVPFTNLNLGGANPVLTVTTSPSSVIENSGTGMVYTFMLDANAASNTTVNFSVSGTATFTTDYTASGAATFNASTGAVVISSGSNSATVTLTPVGDANLEPDETAILTAASGTGYDIGGPGSATGTIINDDTLSITPIVAVTGLNHTSDGFSFVALDDIPGGTAVYFTENSFNNSLLSFTGSEAVVGWSAPAGGVLRGEVIVVTESVANIFTVTCNSGTCGSVSIISGNFSLASNGEGLFAYQDTDTDHTNGVTQVDAVLFTGTSTISGGNIPVIENPSTDYIGAIVVDGFPASAPIRTEYNPTLRGVTVDQANFQNTGNWLHAQASATLSPIPFTDIIIATGPTNPTATLTLTPTSVVEDSGTGMVYTFSLSALAVGDITVNFTVAGTATLTTDYTQQEQLLLLPLMEPLSF